VRNAKRGCFAAERGDMDTRTHSVEKGFYYFTIYRPPSLGPLRNRW